MTARALLFDLDETLVVEHASIDAAFLATCRHAESRGVAPEALCESIRRRSRYLWHAGPIFEYCRGVGISSWEGLHGVFAGDDPNSKALRDWIPAFRREAWSASLADFGVHDSKLAMELTDLFRRERRSRHVKFPDTDATLARLRPKYRFGMITNGAVDIQGEKIARTGIGPFFDAIVVSADVGVGKPDVRIFQHATGRLRIDAREAVMIGDSLDRDIAGARAAGIASIWVDREGRDPTPKGCTRVTSLAELVPLLC
jgi:putative hydrolase of the HAD superfamily